MTTDLFTGRGFESWLGSIA